METTQNGSNGDHQAVVDGVKQAAPKKHFKIKKPRRRALFSVAGVTLVLAGMVFVGYFLVYKPANDYAIKVGSSELSKDEYAKIIVEYKKSIDPSIKDDKELQAYIVDTFKLREIAAEYSIDVSKEEIEEYAKNYYGEDTATVWQNIVAERLIYEAATSVNDDGKKKVAYIAVPFSLHFASGQGAGPGGVDPEGYGDQQVIASDKQLAQERIAKYKQTLTDSPDTTTAEKIIKEITSDKVLSYGITKNRSAVYTVDETGRVDYGDEFMNISIPEDDAKAIFSLNGGATDTLTETGNKYFSSVEGYNKDGVEIAYYIYVDIGGNSDTATMEDISKATKEIKVSINV